MRDMWDGQSGWRRWWRRVIYSDKLVGWLFSVPGIVFTAYVVWYYAREAAATVWVGLCGDIAQVHVSTWVIVVVLFAVSLLCGVYWCVVSENDEDENNERR